MIWLNHVFMCKPILLLLPGCMHVEHYWKNPSIQGHMSPNSCFNFWSRYNMKYLIVDYMEEWRVVNWINKHTYLSIPSPPPPTHTLSISTIQACMVYPLSDYVSVLSTFGGLCKIRPRLTPLAGTFHWYIARPRQTASHWSWRQEKAVVLIGSIIGTQPYAVHHVSTGKYRI